MRVAVLASGRGSNLEALLEACQGHAPARVVLVASDRPTAPALERARARGVATHLIAHPSDGAALGRVLSQAQVDLVVLAGYLKLVPQAVVAQFRDRIINIHPALLPAFGGPGMYGLRVHQAVLASGATISGATVHLVNEEYDRGPIVAQWPVPVAPDDTPASLAARVLEVEHRLLVRVVLEAARAGRVVRLLPHTGYGEPHLVPEDEPPGQKHPGNESPRPAAGP
jgi:formyltetrahydrofolate-dependent phosphoribosylglycinamide formyltransferase